MRLAALLFCSVWSVWTLCSVSSAVLAQGYRPPEVADPKPWEETPIALPAAPKPENLLPFKVVSPTATFEHFIDAGSLSLGNDGVVRYTVVVRSASGAENVFYEGIRCVSRERRVYAYGRPDASWGEAKQSHWSRIINSSGSYPAILYQEFFCPRERIIDSAPEGIDALKRGAHPRASSEPR